MSSKNIDRIFHNGEEMPFDEAQVPDPGGDWVDYGFGASEKWEPSKIGDSISGVYQGLRRLEFLDSKTGLLEPFYLGAIQTNKGLRSVGGFVPVKNIFPTLPTGVRIMIQYIGNIDIPKHPSPMKNYRYFIDGSDQEKVDTFRIKLAEGAKTTIN